MEYPKLKICEMNSCRINATLKCKKAHEKLTFQHLGPTLMPNNSITTDSTLTLLVDHHDNSIYMYYP